MLTTIYNPSWRRKYILQKLKKLSMDCRWISNISSKLVKEHFPDYQLFWHANIFKSCQVTKLWQSHEALKLLRFHPTLYHTVVSGKRINCWQKIAQKGLQKEINPKCNPVNYIIYGVALYLLVCTLALSLAAFYITLDQIITNYHDKRWK